MTRTLVLWLAVALVALMAYLTIQVWLTSGFDGFSKNVRPSVT